MHKKEPCIVVENALLTKDTEQITLPNKQEYLSRSLSSDAFMRSAQGGELVLAKRRKAIEEAADAEEILAIHNSDLVYILDIGQREIELHCENGKPPTLLEKRVFQFLRFEYSRRNPSMKEPVTTNIPLSIEEYAKATGRAINPNNLKQISKEIVEALENLFKRYVFFDPDFRFYDKCTKKHFHVGGDGKIQIRVLRALETRVQNGYIVAMLNLEFAQMLSFTPRVLSDRRILLLPPRSEASTLAEFCFQRYHGNYEKASGNIFTLATVAKIIGCPTVEQVRESFGSNYKAKIQKPVLTAIEQISSDKGQPLFLIALHTENKERVSIEQALKLNVTDFSNLRMEFEPTSIELIQAVKKTSEARVARAIDLATKKVSRKVRKSAPKKDLK